MTAITKVPALAPRSSPAPRPAPCEAQRPARPVRRMLAASRSSYSDPIVADVKKEGRERLRERERQVAAEAERDRLPRVGGARLRRLAARWSWAWRRRSRTSWLGRSAPAHQRGGERSGGGRTRATASGRCAPA